MVENTPHPDDEDDGEYELEPIDPAILEHERRRAEEKTRQAEAMVDINEAYDSVDAPDPLSLDDLRGYRFTVRHLMIATAVLAVMMSAVKLQGCAGLFVVGAAMLAAGWVFVLRKERRERRQRERQRAGLPAEPVAVAPARPPLRIAFSMKQMIAAVTVAALALGLVRFLGGPEQAAIMLGMIALLGVAIHLFGFEPPPVVVLGWWLVLVLYIVVSLWAALATSMGP